MRLPSMDSSSDLETPRRQSRAIGLGMLLLVLVLLGGCSDAWRPTPPGTERIRGRVTVGARPVRGGWIEFIPIDGAVGPLRSAPIGPDGSFLATNVTRGRNVVRIVNPPSPPAVDRIFQGFQSPVRPEITGDRALEVDLAQPSSWGPDPARASARTTPPADEPA